VRVPEDTHNEATQIAALRRVQPGELLAEAWREYVEKHREEFAKDLETIAGLLRDGTIEQLAEFANRSSKGRAAKAVERLNSKRTAPEQGAADAATSADSKERVHV
jgi:hypothetical protein